MAFISGVQVLPRPTAGSQLCVRGFFGSNVIPSSVRGSPRAIVRMAGLPVFTKAMDEFKQDYPQFAKFGWGATVKAERWNVSFPAFLSHNLRRNPLRIWCRHCVSFFGNANAHWPGSTLVLLRFNCTQGRHAMFGLLALTLTAYAKGHGLIPEGSAVLDMSQWGPLAALGDAEPISKERAIILIAHIHVLLVSIAAAIAPFSFQDKLFLQPGEADEEPAGLIPPFSLGLTKDAELWNSRVVCLQLVC